MAETATKGALAEATQSLPERASEAGIAGAMVRAKAEIEAAIVVAKRFPRDELASGQKLRRSMERASAAECALYRFPRGGQAIEGPSVNLAREAARCWGNIRYGLRIVSEDDERVHIAGVAFDAETNTLVEAEDKFAKLVYRKQGGWVRPDERDLRELINRRGAICVRNAILQLIPADIVDDAVKVAKETMRKAAEGELKESPQETLKRVLARFGRLGVSPEMVSSYLGHPLTDINAEELASLRAIGRSMEDGQTRREDHFEIAAKREVASVDLDAVKPGTPSARTSPTTTNAPAVAHLGPESGTDGNPTPAPATREGVREALRKTFAEVLRGLGRSPEDIQASWTALSSRDYVNEEAFANEVSSYLDAAEEMGKRSGPPVSSAPTNLSEARSAREANLKAAVAKSERAPAQKSLL